MSLTKHIELPNGVRYSQPLGLYINGEFVKSIEGKTFEVINPTDESVICSVYEATEKDVDIAVKAARDSFDGEWSTVTPAARGKLLNNLANLFEENRTLLSSVESLDNGKSLTYSALDVNGAASCLRYYGGWADKVHGKVIDTQPGTFNFTKLEPIGVCGQIIPWNFPLLMWAWKIGPAIATGNVVVLKSAEQTPLSALVAAELVSKAGFPKGVVNIISGFGKVAGAAISNHMGVDKVAFTGSTLVGRTILKAAANSNLKKVTLELGGKSPNIIFNDADLDKAIEWANMGIFFNHGQCCCAGSRIYVQEDIYETFVEKFKARISAIRLGDPFHDETYQGPQVSQLQFDRIMGYIEHGKKEGAIVLCGGKRYGSKGYFIEPTIFSNVKTDMKIMQEEIFGPVASIAKFKDVDDIVAIGNATSYGLAAAVHTNDLNTALNVSNRLKAGTCWVNCYNMLSTALPFGGFKESGVGRELGKAALANYTQVKTVQINMGGLG
ncbi:aldehyde dehydrogenase [Wilcoxina mikolae CBS 423.85]|nr:aldehyde dehydrogenase [Wilcoxina mikolae CBS 423.85]